MGATTAPVIGLNPPVGGHVEKNDIAVVGRNATGAGATSAEGDTDKNRSPTGLGDIPHGSGAPGKGPQLPDLTGVMHERPTHPAVGPPAYHEAGLAETVPHVDPSARDVPDGRPPVGMDPVVGAAAVGGTVVGAEVIDPIGEVAETASTRGPAARVRGTASPTGVAGTVKEIRHRREREPP